MAMRCRDQSQQDYTVQARTGPRRPLTASLARCQGGRTACLPEEHQDRLGRQPALAAPAGGQGVCVALRAQRLFYDL